MHPHGTGRAGCLRKKKAGASRRLRIHHRSRYGHHVPGNLPQPTDLQHHQRAGSQPEEVHRGRRGNRKNQQGRGLRRRRCRHRSRHRDSGHGGRKSRSQRDSWVSFRKNRIKKCKVKAEPLHTKERMVRSGFHVPMCIYA